MKVLLLPTVNGSFLDPPILSGLFDVPGIDEENPPAKLSVLLTRKREQLYRDVWEHIGFHRIGVLQPDRDPFFEIRVPAYQLTGLVLV